MSLAGLRTSAVMVAWLKREVLDGEKVKDAQKRIRKAAARRAKAQAKKEEAVETEA